VKFVFTIPGIPLLRKFYDTGVRKDPRVGVIVIVVMVQPVLSLSLCSLVRKDPNLAALEVLLTSPTCFHFVSDHHIVA